MELIDRYLYQVGRYLSVKQRKDILSELRSSIEDSVEAIGGGDEEKNVLAVLQEMGEPKQIAASYFPEGQYFIGPTLYPLFLMVIQISLTAYVGVQLLVILVSLAFSPETFSFGDNVSQILNGIPIALGWVVIVFAILQRFEVEVDLDEDKEFDPRELPALADVKPIKRGELTFKIIINVIVLVLLSRFASGGGFTGTDGAGFFANPVIERYFPWIVLAMLLEIVTDIFLMRQGGWQLWTRVLKIGEYLFSIIVLVLLLQGHALWLNEVGITSFQAGFEQIEQYIGVNMQIVGMVNFRIFFAVALLVTTIEAAVTFAQLLIDLVRKNRLVVTVER